MRTLQKGFRMTGNPDLVNDLVRYTRASLMTKSFINGLVQDTILDWYYISSSDESFGECFIRKFKDKVDWNEISRHQKLSEPFIREFSSQVDWESISYNQKLSESLIREFSSQVHWEGISYTQTLSESFRQEFRHKWQVKHEISERIP